MDLGSVGPGMAAAVPHRARGQDRQEPAAPRPLAAIDDGRGGRAPRQSVGATAIRRVDEGGSFWTVMADPEGNEFCVLRGPTTTPPRSVPRDRRLTRSPRCRTPSRELVRDGDTVAIEGFTHLICFAAGHEIIRQRRRDLTLARMTPDVVYDQMIGAGVASKLIFSWMGNPGVGNLHAVRRRIEKADPAPLEIEEYSHFGMVCRYMAGAANLPFFPIRSYYESDIPSVNPKIVPMTSPYDPDDEVYVVPPLRPDVAIVHAQRADAAGDTQIWGLLGCQKEVAFAADKVIVVVEEVVDESVIRRDPNRTVIPGVVVDAVVEEPFACHPQLRPGLLRPRQPLLPGVGSHREGSRDARRLVRRVGVRPREPRRVRREVRRRVLGRAPARAGAVRARSTTGGTRESRRPAPADLGYSKSEIMIAASARRLGGVTNCFVGVGLPNIVCNLAQRTVAPTLQLVYESGVFGARPERLPLSIGDPTLATGLDRGHQHVRAVRVLPAGGADRRRVPRRCPDRPLREPEHDRDRRLRAPEGSPARVGRRVRDRDPREADPRDHAAGAAVVRRHAGLPDLARAQRATRRTTPRAAGTAAVRRASSRTWAPTASTRRRGR